MQSKTSGEDRKNKDAELLLSIRENERLRLQSPILQKRNEDLEHRTVEMEARANVYKSVVAKQAQELAQLRADLKSMEIDCESKNTMLATQQQGLSRLQGDLAMMDGGCAQRDREIQRITNELKSMEAECESKDRALAAQSQELSRVRGDLVTSESRCKRKEKEIQKMAEDKERLYVTYEGFEMQAAELRDKLSECYTRLARRGRTEGPSWRHEQTSRKRQVPSSYKQRRPITDPHAFQFDRH